MNRGNFALEGDDEVKRNCCGLRGRGFEDFSREDLRDIILHKNKVIADLEEHAYGSASWIENLNKGIKKAKEIKDKVDKKPPKETDEEFRKRLEEFDKGSAPTEAWGADELNGGAAAPTPTEPKVSPVAAAAAALKPVREKIQNGIGDALYGKEDDPRKQKKGLLGISEEGKEESKKKVMKNIVVPIVKTAREFGKNVKDTANMIFNKDQYDADMKAERIQRIKKREAEAGIVRDKENPSIIIRKPAGLWKSETTDPSEKSYDQERVASRKDQDVFYIRVPNPIFAAKLRPSFQELAKAGFVKQVGNDKQLDLWTGVNQFDKNEDIDGTLKSLHDDAFIWIPEDRAKDIYGKLRQFVADKQDEEVAVGYEDEGWTKGDLKRFAKIDPRTLKGQELIEWKESKLALDKAQTQNALEKVNKDIADEEAKEGRVLVVGERPTILKADQARLAKMREAKERVLKRQKDLVLRGQQEFNDMMMFQNAEKAKRDAEYYARQKAEGEESMAEMNADIAAWNAKPVAEKIAILEEQLADPNNNPTEIADYNEQLEQLRAEEASNKVEEQAQGSVDLLQQAEVEGGAKPCWKGYEMIGMKKKGKRIVPNCVPIGGAKSDPVQMKQSDYFKEHANIVKLLKDTGNSLLSEAKDQQDEASAMAKKMGGFSREEEEELLGAGAIEYTLQKAGMRLFNPTRDLSKAERQSFTPDYDAYGLTAEQGRQNAFNLARSMYDQTKAIELPDFKMIRDDTSLRFYRKDDENVILVGIRGTDVKSWTDLYTWAVIGVSADLRLTTRFQEDLAKLVAFQRNYPPSQFYYVATGSSLAGSIADRFLELGLIEEAITYNPSIERKHLLDENILNHRIYLDTDPLFILMGQYSPNTEIRVNPNKTNYYNPSKEKDYLIKSHSIYPVYNPAFEGGGMEGSGKTYTLEEWKAIFDAKLEEKRKAIEAREAKKKQTAKAKRERAKARREEREKPKAPPEPEPEEEEEEPEVEVAEYKMGDEVYWVEEPKEGLAFDERRVFDSEYEEIGNLTVDDVGKTLVKMVMRREKIGAFADKSPKAKSSSESLPFFESQQPKAPKAPKAPASARVELREELVAEQPRSPAGEFAKPAETAVVAVSQAPQQAYMKLMKSPAFTEAERKLLTRIRETKMTPRMRAVLLGRSGLARKVMDILGIDESAFQSQRARARIADKVEKRVESKKGRDVIDPPASFRDEFRAVIDAHREMPSKEKASVMKKLDASFEKYKKQVEAFGQVSKVTAIITRTKKEMEVQASLSAPVLKDELYRSQMTSWFGNVFHFEVKPASAGYGGYDLFMRKMVRPNGEVIDFSRFTREFFAEDFTDRDAGNYALTSEWIRTKDKYTRIERKFIEDECGYQASFPCGKNGLQLNHNRYSGAFGLNRHYMRSFIENYYRYFTPREWCDEREFDKWLGLPQLFALPPYQYRDDGRVVKQDEADTRRYIQRAEEYWDDTIWRKVGNFQDYKERVDYMGRRR